MTLKTQYKIIRKTRYKPTLKNVRKTVKYHIYYKPKIFIFFKIDIWFKYKVRDDKKYIPVVLRRKRDAFEYIKGLNKKYISEN